MQILSALNWWAILVASVAGMAFFTLVSGLFTGADYAALGIKPEEVMPPPLAPALVLLFTAYLSTSVVIALMIYGLGLNAWPQGIAIGLLVGVALFATSAFSGSGLFGDPFLPRHFNVKLALIKAVPRVTYPMVMGLILVLWQKDAS